MFTPDQIRAVLSKANKPMKAMMLLGINCGFGNEDCATLPLDVLDLKLGWVDYARPKTAVERACPLWEETILALKDYLADRPKPASKEFEGLVFLTQTGLGWSDGTRRNPITKEFTKLLEKLKIKRLGLSFYALRHTFYTRGGVLPRQGRPGIHHGPCGRWGGYAAVLSRGDLDQSAAHYRTARSPMGL